MKIGILTFHNALNYGAVLQAFALQFYCKSKGHDVYIINYENEKIQRSYRNFRFDSLTKGRPLYVLHKFISEVLMVIPRKIRSDVFRKFLNKRMQLIDFTPDKINTLNFFLVGSDQVWNTRLTGGVATPYWGIFPFICNAKMISYAASIGEPWMRDEEARIVQSLNNFVAISVRERTAADKLSQLLSRKINVAMDPTFLLSSQQWSQLAIRPKIKKDYLLVYHVRNAKKTMEVAKAVAKRKDYEIVEIPSSIDFVSDIHNSNCSPQQFLGYIKYAKFIIATSFHGTAFSIIFNRPFLSIKAHDGKDERVNGLLKSIGLMDCFVDSAPLDDIQIDWPKINNLIGKMVEPSKSFLDNSLRS